MFAVLPICRLQGGSDIHNNPKPILQDGSNNCRHGLFCCIRLSESKDFAGLKTLGRDCNGNLSDMPQLHVTQTKATLHFPSGGASSIQRRPTTFLRLVIDKVQKYFIFRNGCSQMVTRNTTRTSSIPSLARADT